MTAAGTAAACRCRGKSRSPGSLGFSPRDAGASPWLPQPAHWARLSVQHPARRRRFHARSLPGRARPAPRRAGPPAGDPGVVGRRPRAPWPSPGPAASAAWSTSGPGPSPCRPGHARALLASGPLEDGRLPSDTCVWLAAAWGRCPGRRAAHRRQPGRAYGGRLPELLPGRAAARRLRHGPATGRLADCAAACVPRARAGTGRPRPDRLCASGAFAVPRGGGARRTRTAVRMPPTAPCLRRVRPRRADRLDRRFRAKWCVRCTDASRRLRWQTPRPPYSFEEPVDSDVDLHVPQQPRRVRHAPGHRPPRGDRRRAARSAPAPATAPRCCGSPPPTPSPGRRSGSTRWGARSSACSWC